MTRDLTTGSPLKLILTFMVPVFLGNMFQQFYNIADTVIVGRFLGVQALAAVGSTGSLYFLVIGFVTGMCSGFCVPIARYFGAKDMKSIHACLANQIYLCVVIIVLLTSVVMIFARPILTLMNTPADIYQEAYSYIIVIFAGVGVTMFYNLLANISRAVGDSRTPLYFLVVASVLNIGLDLLFIVVFKMGTAGAGYATVAAQGVAGIACLVYMYKKFPELRFSLKEMRPDFYIIKYLLNMGLPMALQFSITAVGSIILQSAINPLGSLVVAAVTAASKVQILLMQTFEAVAITMATFCSQNLGAGKIKRISQGVRTSVFLVFAFSVVTFLVANFGGPTISRLFVSGEQPELMGYIKQFLFYNSCFHCVLGILVILRSSIQGLGFALPAMAAGIFEMAARSFVAFALVGTFAFDAICFANPIAWFAAVILLIPVYFISIKKLRVQFGIESV